MQHEVIHDELGIVNEWQKESVWTNQVMTIALADCKEMAATCQNLFKLISRSS
jgi:hypothetical protein